MCSIQMENIVIIFHNITVYCSFDQINTASVSRRFLMFLKEVSFVNVF